eukprot:SAG11_NODE_107_length_16392_cov_18.393666_3_plen_137_part_00
MRARRRLAETREELCNATLVGKQQAMRVRAENGELARRAQLLAEEVGHARRGTPELSTELNEQRTIAAHSLGKMKAECAEAGEEWRQQMARKERELQRQRSKVRELITQAAEQQARHQLYTQELQGDIERLCALKL